MKDTKLRILFLINSLGVGGAERVFIKDSNTLFAMGHPVYMAFLFGDEKKQTLLSNLSLPNDHVYFAKAKNLYDITAVYKLATYIRAENIDVVYATLNEANIWARLLKLFVPKVRVIIREANIAGPKPIHFKAFDLVANFLTHRIVCVSEEVMDSMSYQAIHAHKNVVLMNGVVIPEQPKTYADTKPVPLQILNVGSLTPKKGQKFLIEACHQVLQKYPESITLSIYGAGVEEKNLRALIQQYGREKELHIKAPVSPQEITEVYRTADLFVLSSLHEGCPNVLLEAMATGLASVSTKVSGANSILTPECGILVDVGNSTHIAEGIMHMLEHYDMLRSYGSAARARMQQEFSVEAHIEKLLALMYEKTS